MSLVLYDHICGFSKKYQSYLFCPLTFIIVQYLSLSSMPGNRDRNNYYLFLFFTRTMIFFVPRRTIDDTGVMDIRKKYAYSVVAPAPTKQNTGHTNYYR